MREREDGRLLQGIQKPEFKDESHAREIRVCTARTRKNCREPWDRKAPGRGLPIER